jgi:hypothetical protein
VRKRLAIFSKDTRGFTKQLEASKEHWLRKAVLMI